MAIVLFSKTDFRGDSFVVNQSFSDLKNTPVGFSTSSIRLETRDDVALFFRRTGWHCEVLFRRGPKNISHAGRSGQGGKVGFANDIRSVRTTPFGLHLRLHVVTSESGQFPGGLPDSQAVDRYLSDALVEANALWAPFLLRYNLLETRRLASDKLFNIAGRREFLAVIVSRNIGAVSACWNAYFVNDAGRPGGISEPRAISNRMVFAYVADIIGNRRPDVAGFTLAHETGHFLGQVAHTIDSSNLMHREAVLDSAGVNITNRSLEDKQVEGFHEVLGRNSDDQRGVRMENGKFDLPEGPKPSLPGQHGEQP
jgi:hypothetical protein